MDKKIDILNKGMVESRNLREGIPFSQYDFTKEDYDFCYEEIDDDDDLEDDDDDQMQTESFDDDDFEASNGEEEEMINEIA